MAIVSFIMRTDDPKHFVQIQQTSNMIEDRIVADVFITERLEKHVLEVVQGHLASALALRPLIRQRCTEVSLSHD